MSVSMSALLHTFF